MRKSEWLVCLVLVLALCWPGQSPAEEMAVVDVSSAAVRWDLQGGDFEKVVLTVSLPSGNVIRREVQGGQPVVFELDSAAKDGFYTYQLRGIPRLDASVRRELAAARKAGNEAEVIRGLREAGRLPGEMVQSGVFSVLGGSILSPDLREEVLQRKSAASGVQLITASEVVPEDLIVQGSLCVGVDCVDEESFGTDTIRLKANNLRIKFEDTSTAAGFASNDWQLTVNDSTNGGANKFSIEDITGSKVPFTITAGAATNSVFIASDGKVGIGTASPANKLDIECNTAADACVRVLNASATGFSGFGLAEEGGVVSSFFGTDNANNNTRLNSTNSFPLVVMTQSTERMRITSGGDVGIGTASPDTKLDVEANLADAAMQIRNSNASGYSGISYTDEGGSISLYVGTDNASNNSRINSVNSYPLVLLTQNTEHMRVDSDGDVGINCNNPTSDLVIASSGGCSNPASSINAGATAFTASSSRFIKENLEPVHVPGILERIAAIDVYNYDFIGGPKDRVGLMAEDFHQVFQRGVDKLLDGQEVEMALWLAVKELTAQNKELMIKNRDLADRLDRLEQRLSAE